MIGLLHTAASSLLGRFGSQNEIRARRERLLRRAYLAASLGHYAKELAATRQLAYVDQLTGLANRHALAKHLTERREADPSLIGVAVIDLDHFKKINDTQGHQAGDAVLRHVAALLKHHVRTEDSLTVRAGGEEIYLFMPMNSAGELSAKLESLREIIAATPCPYGDLAIKVTASFGGTMHMTARETYQQAIDRADQAVYISKASGRNCVTIADNPHAEPSTAAPQRLTSKIPSPRVFGRRLAAG